MQIVPHLVGTFCTVKMQIFAHNPAACYTYCRNSVEPLERSKYQRSQFILQKVHIISTSPTSFPCATSPVTVFSWVLPQSHQPTRHFIHPCTLHWLPTSTQVLFSYTSLHIRWIRVELVKHNYILNKKMVAQVLMFSHCPIFFFLEWHLTEVPHELRSKSDF